jgi:hypothetical protein
MINLRLCFKPIYQNIFLNENPCFVSSFDSLKFISTKPTLLNVKMSSFGQQQFHFSWSNCELKSQPQITGHCTVLYASWSAKIK